MDAELIATAVGLFFTMLGGLWTVAQFLLGKIEDLGKSVSERISALHTKVETVRETYVRRDDDSRDKLQLNTEIGALRDKVGELTTSVAEVTLKIDLVADKLDRREVTAKEHFDEQQEVLTAIRDSLARQEQHHRDESKRRI